MIEAGEVVPRLGCQRIFWHHFSSYSIFIPNQVRTISVAEAAIGFLAETLLRVQYFLLLLTELVFV